MRPHSIFIHFVDKIRKKLEFDSKPTCTSKRIRVPQESQEYAQSVKKLVVNCSPKKQKALKEKGIYLFSPRKIRIHATNAQIVANIKVALKRLKKSQNVRDKHILPNC